MCSLGSWFKFEPGTGPHANHFRLITHSKRPLFSRTDTQPYLSNAEPEDPASADQYFSFLFEDMRVDGVEYDLKMGKIVSATPVVLADQTFKNESKLKQEMSFQLAESATHTSTFEYATGFPISVGAKVSGASSFASCCRR